MGVRWQVHGVAPGHGCWPEAIVLKGRSFSLVHCCPADYPFHQCAVLWLLMLCPATHAPDTVLGLLQMTRHLCRQTMPALLAHPASRTASSRPCAPWGRLFCPGGTPGSSGCLTCLLSVCCCLLFVWGFGRLLVFD